MRKNYYRPPYILAHNADASGCGHHRILRPIEIMMRSGFVAGRYDMRIWTDDEVRTLLPDVVVWQRQHEDMQIANMARYRKAAPDAFYVYEIDDALSAVPDWSYHKPFLSVDVDKRMTRALEHVDVVTVTTNELARHMRNVTGGVRPVRVAPNMLGADDFDTCDMITNQTKKLRTRLRVGWYGGISHKGDLSLIAKAVDATAKDIDWVFFGMKPDCEAPVEFHEGVSVREYLLRLAALDLDLIVAPIEDNHFNRCKSNLRLIESGACGYPVIASPVLPYKENMPPITYTEDWADAIMEFALLPLEERYARGAKLRDWARKHYCLEGEKLDKRTKAWLPDHANLFKPNNNGRGDTNLVIVAPQDIDELKEYGKQVRSLEEARDSRADVLYVRWDCTVDKEMVNKLRVRLADRTIASVCPMTNDGGPGGFPVPMLFQNVDIETGDKIAKICDENFTGRNEQIMAPVGPVSLIARRALDFVGYFDEGLPTEAAIIEWALMASSRGMKNVVAADCYSISLAPHAVPGVEVVARRAQARWPVPQLPPDILAPVRRDIELAFHNKHYITPLPLQQPNYSEWAAIFDTPGEFDRYQIQELTCIWENRPRFKVQVLPSLGGETIIEHDVYLKHPDASAPADWILYVREGSMLAPHAAYMLACAIRDNPNADVVYGDHDVLTHEAVRTDHDFKPLLFDLDLFLCRDYVTPICAVRADYNIATQPGPLKAAEARSEEQLYERLLELADGPAGRFVHVPRVLAHLKPSNPEHEFVQRKKRLDAANRVMAGKATLAPHPGFVGYSLAMWNLPDNPPKVSIIIPTKNKVEMISPCLATLLQMTDYPNYEILVVDNGSTHEATLEYLASIKDPRVKVLRHDVEFNWSEINNWAATNHATGELLLFMNDDVRVVEPTWLKAMVGTALSRANIGIVGARLLYPMGAVQHVGVACSYGLCGHIHKTLHIAHPGYQGIAVLNHESTAVTGACMLVKRGVYDHVGGFDQRYAHNFNDVAFCLSARNAGYLSVLAATAQLQHLEGVSRGPAGPRMRDEMKLLVQNFPAPDPYWNRNLIFTHTVDGTQVAGMGMDTLRWPGDAWPWRGEAWPRQRVLLVGDDGLQAIKEAREGNIIFRAALNGFNFGIGQPVLQNVHPWDIRNAPAAATGLKRLGIDRILFCGLQDGGERLLGFLTKLGISIEYRPGNVEAICPFRNFTPNGKACEDGWRHGHCQGCIDSHISPFGYVTINGWQENWRNFISAVTISDARLTPEHKAAMQEVYPESF